MIGGLFDGTGTAVIFAIVFYSICNLPIFRAIPYPQESESNFKSDVFGYVCFLVPLVFGLCNCKLRTGYRNMPAVEAGFSTGMEYHI